MITYRKLRLFQSYEGNADLVFRNGVGRHISYVDTSGDWYLMAELLQDAHALREGSLEADEAALLREKIISHTADEAARKLLHKMARTWPRVRRRLRHRVCEFALLWPIYVVLIIAAGEHEASPEWLVKLVRFIFVAGFAILLWLFFKTATNYLMGWLG